MLRDIFLELWILTSVINHEKLFHGSWKPQSSDHDFSTKPNSIMCPFYMSNFYACFTLKQTEPFKIERNANSWWIIIYIQSTILCINMITSKGRIVYTCVLTLTSRSFHLNCRLEWIGIDRFLLSLLFSLLFIMEVFFCVTVLKYASIKMEDLFGK